MAQAHLVHPELSVLSQQQASLQIVQTLLGASIGSLSFIRGLFTDDCFTKLCYEPEYSQNYRAFSTATAEPRSRGQGVKVTRLRRGVSKYVDLLLDYLEKGVFQALNDGQLKALQLGIHTDEDDPEQAAESYTFSVSYHAQNAISLHISDLAGKELVVADAHKRVQQVTRNLLTITESLHPLPDSRWLSIRLHYQDHTPPDYDVPGFRRLKVDVPGLKLAGNVVSQRCGVMDTGIHAVSLRVASCQSAETAEEIPGRQMSQIFDADDDVDFYYSLGSLPDIPDLFHLTQDSINESHSGVLHSQRIEATQNSDKNPLTDTGDKADLFEAKAVPQSGQDIEMLDVSQSQEIAWETPMGEEPTVPCEATEKGYIDRLLQPDQKPADAPPTQETPNHTQVAASSQMRSPSHMLPPSHNSSVIREPDAGKILYGLPTTTELQAVLSDAKSEELEKKKQRNRKPKGKRARKKDIVACECGDITLDDGGLLCCDICDEWQHARCYGYNSVDDPRIPAEHYCYHCLLNGAQEKLLLQTMKDLAFFRHGLLYIWITEQFPTSIDVLGAELQCTPEAATALLKRLVEEGFVVSKHVPAWGRSNGLELQRCRVVKSVQTEERLRVEYCNPLKYIEHHYVRMAKVREDVGKGDSFSGYEVKGREPKGEGDSGGAHKEDESKGREIDLDLDLDDVSAPLMFPL